MKNPWKCQKCGSTEVEQEYSFMVPMNQYDENDENFYDSDKSDWFWCPKCEDECYPIRDEE